MQYFRVTRNSDNKEILIKIEDIKIIEPLCDAHVKRSNKAKTRLFLNDLEFVDVNESEIDLKNKVVNLGG